MVMDVKFDGRPNKTEEGGDSIPSLSFKARIAGIRLSYQKRSEKPGKSPNILN
jgi:hypothetical protein